MRIQDLTHTSKCSEESLSKAIKWLNSKSVENGVSWNANFAIFEVGGKKYQRYGKQCHLDVQIRTDKEKDCLALYTNWRVNPYCPPLADKGPGVVSYWNWLVNDSFVTPFLLHSDIDTGVVISSDIPSPLIQSICIMFRHIRELPKNYFDLFEEIISKGFSKEIAYALAFNTSTPAKGDIFSNPVGRSGVGHRAWGTFSLPAMKNFLEGKFFIPDTHPIYRNAPLMYGGIRYCYNESPLSSPIFYEELYTCPEYREALSAYRRNRQEKIYHPPNPFVRVAEKSAESQFTYKELIEFVLPYCKEKGTLNV